MNRLCLEHGGGDRYFEASTAGGGACGEIVVSSPENAAHIRAIRLRDGERVEFVSFEGEEFSRLFVSVFRGSCGKNEYAFDVEEILELPPEQPVIHLFQAKTRGAKLDFIAQRAVEAGACKIVFCDTEYSDKSGNIKAERLSKIAKEAALQCKASVLPVVEVGKNLKDFDFSGYDRVFFFYEGASKRVEALGGFGKSKKFAVVIGSEGGFSESEAKWAEEKFGSAYSLGSRVYRAETASIAALAIVRHESEV